MASPPGISRYPGLAQDGYGFGKLPRVRKRMDRQSCQGRVWIFLVLGIPLVLLGLVITGVYLNTQSITSSVQYTEILPTYVTAILAFVAGCSVILLFWRRLKYLVFICVAVVVAVALVCGITAILTYTHVLRPIQSATRCRYYASQELCQCFSPYKRDLLKLAFSETELTKYDFEKVSSCEVVEDAIPQLLFTLISVYSCIFLICVAAAIVALLVLRIETKRRHGFFEGEPYEEVYTVSGSSSQDQSDSETDATPEVVTSPTGPTILPTVSGSQAKSATLVKTPVPSKRDKAPQGIHMSSTFPAFNRTSNAPEGDLCARNGSIVNSKRLSRSCDSLDYSGRHGDSCQGNNEFGTSCSDGKKKGKLKEHRRKGRRAVTLHNLDTKQLMLILNLQMRYIQETKELQSQSVKDVSRSADSKARRSVSPQVANKATPRRAITPQPCTQQPALPQHIRSHTPQPYKTTQRSRAQQEHDFYAQFGTVPITGKHSQEAYYHSTGRQGKHIPAGQGQGQGQRTTATVHQGYREAQTYLHPDNIHYVAYDDNMLHMQGPKPKSRSCVANCFLPDQPIHRSNKDPLPPRPITRQQSLEQALPPEPIHRGGKSAFQVVESHRNKSRSPSVSSDKGSPHTLTMSGKQRQKKTDYAQTAIQDNFRMHPSPFMLKHLDTDVDSIAVPVKSRQSQAPPYAPPPSYREFVSSCDHSVTSSTSSNPEEIYSTPLPKHGNQPRPPPPTRKTSREDFQALTTPAAETFYGNADSLTSAAYLNAVSGQGQEVRGQKPVYITPSKSKVKQSIVPEDYYTPVRRNCRTHEQPVYANANQVDHVGSPHARPSGRHRTASDQGNRNQPTKFHEYEDVYDTPGNESLPQTVPQENGAHLDPRFRGQSSQGKKMEEKKKRNDIPNLYQSKELSPASEPYTGKRGKVKNQSKMNNNHVGLYNIPAVKLNDQIDLADDDVFESENTQQQVATGDWVPVYNEHSQNQVVAGNQSKHQGSVSQSESLSESQSEDVSVRLLPDGTDSEGDCEGSSTQGTEPCSEDRANQSISESEYAETGV